MRLFRGLSALASFGAGGCVLTVGNFDGLHLGHQAVIGQLRERALSLGLPSVVLLFEPQPREFFAFEALASGRVERLDEMMPGRLFRLRDKLNGLAALGVDAVVLLRFDRRLASLSARDFVREVLVDGLSVAHVVIGDDFRFGARRAGDFALLRAMGADFGFEVEATRSFLLAGERVSSTAVRACLAQGDLARAERLLGRAYMIAGRVGHGRRLGRELGFPTANIALRRALVPLSGVFAVRLRVCAGGDDADWLNGVASLGVNPTVGALPVPQLEVHVLDFEGDLYGCAVEVALCWKIRDERDFESLDVLVDWIADDCEQARRFFAA